MHALYMLYPYHPLLLASWQEYENVRQMHSKTTARYPKFTKALDHSKLPSNVKEAEQLMQADLKLKESFENKMVEALQSNDRFLEVLKQQQPGATMEMALDTKEHIKMMVSLKLMHQELKEKQDQLNSFWLAHKTRMEHLIHMCNLNERTEEVYICTVHIGLPEQAVGWFPPRFGFGSGQ